MEDLKSVNMSWGMGYCISYCCCVVSVGAGPASGAAVSAVGT